MSDNESIEHSRTRITKLIFRRTPNPIGVTRVGSTNVSVIAQSPREDPLCGGQELALQGERVMVMLEGEKNAVSGDEQ